jgi:predicted anti-sigma-YlaC factor YlaD
MPQRWVDEHLAGCPACRSWAEAAAEVTRRARLAPATPVPDVTAAVLGRLPAPGRPRRSRTHWVDAGLRLALLAVGAGQLAVGLPVFLGGAEAMGEPQHLAHETGAWNLGLAVCFLVVAALPRLAAGSLPFLLSFTGVLVAVTLADLGSGHVHVGRAGLHLLVVGGAVLVSVLALRTRTPGRGPLRTLRGWTTGRTRDSADLGTAVPGPGPRRVPADPAAIAGRRAA